MRRPCRVDPDSLPALEGKPVAIRVRPAAEKPLRDGHPWLFGESVVSVSRPAPAGDIAVIFDRKDRFLAAGLIDPEGPIRVRVLVHERPAEIGPELFRARAEKALAMRAGIASRETTAFRVIHGENDGMPGIVADLYDRSLVLKMYTPAWIPHLRHLVPALRELLAPERVLLLTARKLADGNPPWEGGAVLAGEAPGDGAIPFLEHGLRFEAHPFDGHKTGFYLDQRENRRRLEANVDGGRVLNVFSYSGAFSLYAARGGAGEVLNVDRARPALAQAERHFELNGGEPTVRACRHRTREGDAFAVMEELARRGETFDTVVVDPPSFATAAAHRERALAAYGRLTTLGLSLLRPDGLLVQASCSSRVAAEAFFRRIHASARSAGRPVRELARTGHPPDHPVSFPEGAYLKCLWARVPGGTSG